MARKKLKKGSAAAKAHMARLRAMVGKKKKRKASTRPSNTRKNPGRRGLARGLPKGWTVTGGSGKMYVVLDENGHAVAQSAHADTIVKQARKAIREEKFFARKKNPRRVRRVGRSLAGARSRTGATRRRPRKNPGAAFTVMTRHAGKRCYWVKGNSFETTRSKAKQFRSADAAMKAARQLGRRGGPLAGKRAWVATP